LNIIVDAREELLMRLGLGGYKAGDDKLYLYGTPDQKQEVVDRLQSYFNNKKAHK
jgi:hypothetical protein